MTAAAEQSAPRTREARRLWILEEAERLCVPGWATPRWQSLYGKPADTAKTRAKEDAAQDDEGEK